MATEKFLALRSEFTQGKLLLPGDEGFDNSLKRWSATCIQPAAAVALVTTAEEASAAVKFAASNDIAFNVKGGGHSTSRTSSAPSPDGMVIDLSLMRKVIVNAQDRLVSFQGGCLWKDVDNALWEHGLASIGGTVSHTGVGGLVLHGGFGVLTGLHGLAVDVLVSCQVVLADGRIVTASEKENADLFWAIRGAGSSFGIITEFTSKAFPQTNIWAGAIFFTADKLPKVVDMLNQWYEKNTGNQIFGVFIGHSPPNPEAPDAPRIPILIAQVADVGPNAEKDGPEFFAPILAVDSLMREIGVMPYPVINTLADDKFFPPGFRYQFGGTNFTLPMSLSTAEAIGDKVWSLNKSHPGAGTDGSVAILEGFPNRKIGSVASSSTSFNNRGNYFNLAFVWTWEGEALDTVIREYNRTAQTELRSLGYNDPNLSDGVGGYINYSASDVTTDKAAFGSNAERLREVKAKYDPTNAFNKMWKIEKA